MTVTESLYQPSSNRVIGEVIWLDESAKQAVVYLNSEVAPAGPYLVGRNTQLATTAIFELAGIQRRRAMGVNIIVGTPAIGDEVIMPGPPLAERVRQLLVKESLPPRKLK